MAEIKKYQVTEPYLDLHCSLGEGPFWEHDKNVLRFVDIEKKQVHFVDLTKGPTSHKQLDLGFSIGTTANIERNKDEFIFGGKLGYGIMNRETGESKWIKMVWTDEERKPDGGGKPGVGKNKEERMRSNDGAVDALGRYFVGNMNDQELVGSNFTDEGVLFRLDSDLSLHRVKDTITIPNGISWTKDNKHVYFTDSPTGKVRKYPYYLSTGTISWDSGVDFFTCPYPSGVPDGHAQDEEGCLWIALHGTGKVVRVNTEGDIIAEVELPTRCVTCPAFCGTSLFITTAAEMQPEKYPWSVKYQGGLFKVDVAVRGRLPHEFRMEP